MVSKANIGDDPRDRNLVVLRELASRVAAGEMPPTAREVAAFLGYRSSQSGHKVLAALEEGGLLERWPAPANQRRPVRITERGWRVLGESSVMGRIAAGKGLEAVAQEEAFSLAAELLHPASGRRRYLLRVVGDSMVGARIGDGDLLIVEEGSDPPDGSIVVALMVADHSTAGEEVTVKRLYRERECIRLVAENSEYEDIVLGRGEVQVQGKVVWILRRSD